MKKKNCPVCWGEGEIDETLSVALTSPHPPFLTQISGLIPGVLGLAIVASLAWVLHSWIVASSKPGVDTVEMQCSKACGAGRFKTYTYKTDPWVETDGSKYGKHHEPIAPKCECLEEKHEP